MAKFRMIHTAFWEDARVSEEMTPEDKYFYMYLLTNPSTTQIGIYQITKKKMAFETGYSIETINSLMDRFEHNYELIKYDKETRELAILNWPKYNLNKGGKPIMDCVTKELSEIKSVELIALLAHLVPNESIKEEFIRFSPERRVDNESLHESSTTSGQKEQQQQEEQQEEKEQQQQEAREALEKPKRNVVDNSPGIVFRFYQDNLGHIVPYMAERLSIMIDESSEALVHEALKRAVDVGATNKMNYAESILRGWQSKNLKTLEDIAAADKAFERSKKTGYAGSRKPVREEKLPEWFGQKDEPPVELTANEELEAEKAKILARLEANRIKKEVAK